MGSDARCDVCLMVCGVRLHTMTLQICHLPSDSAPTEAGLSSAHNNDLYSTSHCMHCKVPPLHSLHTCHIMNVSPDSMLPTSLCPHLHVPHSTLRKHLTVYLTALIGVVSSNGVGDPVFPSPWGVCSVCSPNVLVHEHTDMHIHQDAHTTHTQSKIISFSLFSLYLHV